MSAQVLSACPNETQAQISFLLDENMLLTANEHTYNVYN